MLKINSYRLFGIFYLVIFFFPNAIFPNLVFNNAFILGLQVLFCTPIIFLLKKVSRITAIYIFFIVILIIFHITSILANPQSKFVDLSDIFRNFSFLFFFVLGTSIDKVRASYIVEELLVFIVRTLFIFLIVSYLFRDYFDDFENFYGKIDNVVGGRFFLPFYNPYDLGLFLLFPFTLFLLKRNFISFFISFLLIVGTQSRTALLLMVFILLIVFFRIQSVRKNIIYFIIGFIFLLFILYINIDIDDLSKSYLIDNTQKLLVGESTTLTKRFSQWDYLNYNNLLGLGVIHTNEMMIENGYLYEFVKFGIFSLFSILFYFLIPLLLSIIKLFVFRSQNYFYLAICIWLIVFIIANNANVFLYQVKLSFLYWFIFGVFVNDFKFSVTR